MVGVVVGVAVMGVEAESEGMRMENLAMARALHRGEAVDIASLGATPIEGEPGNWLLREAPPEDVDLCVAETETWIWSVDVENVQPGCGFEGGGWRCGSTGCHGRIVASTSAARYGRPGWTCIWAR